MKLKTFFYYFLHVTWGIINNVVALIIAIVLFIVNPRRNRKMFFNSLAIEWKIKCSLGIGIFIFSDLKNEDILVHEYGHNLQSAILGPLFLPLIGIPSLLWCEIPALIKVRRKRNINYYNFYTEKSANKLAKKVTGLNPRER